jgi:hypothetical protein
MIEINDALLKKYLQDGVRHPAFDKTKDIRDHLTFHIDGFTPVDNVNFKISEENPYFRKLIDERRPSEAEKFKKYRREIYASITKGPSFKVINSLRKITKSEDWLIDYSKVENPSRIAEGETLADYCEKKYPFFNSVTAWVEMFGLKSMLSDPNGLIFMSPLDFDVPSDEFKKPFSFFIPSNKVYDFIDGELAVFESEKISEEVAEGGKRITAPIIFLCNKTEIWKATQINEQKDYKLEMVLRHDADKLPLWRAGGS